MHEGAYLKQYMAPVVSYAVDAVNSDELGFGRYGTSYSSSARTTLIAIICPGSLALRCLSGLLKMISAE